MRTSIYLLLMAGSAGLSLVRGFVVAGVLDPADFTAYAVAVALGTFLSNFLSFGLIEGTVKQFPRITASGGAGGLLSLSDDATRRLAWRALLSLPLFAVIMYFVDREHPALLLAVSAVAFGVAVLGLLASVQRALLNVMAVAMANGMRAVLYLALAVIGAWLFGLEGAIAGEVIAALLGAMASREIFKSTLRRRQSLSSAAATSAEAVPEIKAERGITIFVAYSALAAPTYLDRAYVASIFSQPDSAAYAVLALFASGATVFVNIVGQKVGPEIIAREKAGAPVGSLMLSAARWSAAVVVIWIAFIAAAAWLISSGVLPMLAKYALTPSMFFAIMLLGCVQVASLFEFILIARDRESRFMTLSLVYLGAVCLVAALAPVTGLTLLGFIELLALVKFMYLLLILATLRTSRPGTPLPARAE